MISISNIKLAFILLDLYKPPISIDTLLMPPPGLGSPEGVFGNLWHLLVYRLYCTLSKIDFLLLANFSEQAESNESWRDWQDVDTQLMCSLVPTRARVNYIGLSQKLTCRS